MTMTTTSKEWWDLAALLEAKAREAINSGDAGAEERYRLNARSARNAARLAECQERQSSDKANESVSMPTTEERIAAIRMALEAGPTSGEWSVKVDEKYPQLHRVVGDSLVIEGKDGICEPDRMNDRSFSEDRANMAYIAACSPVAIIAVLVEINRLRQDSARATAEKNGLLEILKRHTGFDHGVMAIRSLVERAEKAEAENERMRKALVPFANIAGEPWADSQGWTYAACRNDRVVDWFGPSAFAAASAALKGEAQ